MRLWPDVRPGATFGRVCGAAAVMRLALGELARDRHAADQDQQAGPGFPSPRGFNGNAGPNSRSEGISQLVSGNGVESTLSVASLKAPGPRSTAVENCPFCNNILPPGLRICALCGAEHQKGATKDIVLAGAACGAAAGFAVSVLAQLDWLPLCLAGAVLGIVAVSIARSTTWRWVPGDRSASR